MTFVLEAPAKINWFLSILNRRDDGYHNIVSLMQCVDLFDTLLFEESDTLEVRSDIPDLPMEKNLIFRAARLMQTMTNRHVGARITLKKSIPLAAGLGGGSSDAACTLIGLNRLWEMGLSTATLSDLGAQIGSDVPFFVESIYALAEGRGELITPIEDAPDVALLLVNPGIAVSSAWAYQASQIGLTKKGINIKLFCQSLDNKEFDTLQSFHRNDLEDPVIKAYPEIGKIKTGLLAQGALMAAMSGSGSTVFGVFRTREEAQRASENMGTTWCRAVKTLTRKR